MNIDYLFIFLYYPAIIFLGLKTSYEDLKKGTIRNKLIIISILYSLVSLIIISFVGWKSGTFNVQFYFIKYFSNLFFAFLAAIIFWLAHLWSAGDAKLFIAYSFLIPLNTYTHIYDSNFPSIALLVNIFVPLFIYYLFIILVKQRKNFIESIKFALNPNKFVSLFISFFSITWVISFFSNKFLFFSNIFFMVIFIYLATIIIDLFLPGKHTLWFALVAIARLFLDYQIHSTGFWKTFTIFFVSYLIIRYFILNLSFTYFVKEIYIEDLKPKQMLAQLVTKEGQKYKLQDIFITNLFEGLNKTKGKEVILNAKVLTEKEVSLLKKAHSEGLLSDHKIKIQQFVSFGLFLFIGVIITIIVKGNLFLYLRGL